MSARVVMNRFSPNVGFRDRLAKRHAEQRGMLAEQYALSESNDDYEIALQRSLEDVDIRTVLLRSQVDVVRRNNIDKVAALLYACFIQCLTNNAFVQAPEIQTVFHEARDFPCCEDATDAETVVLRFWTMFYEQEAPQTTAEHAFFNQLCRIVRGIDV